MKEVLSNAGIKYAYCDITESLVFLRAYLRLRDFHPAFDAVKELPSLGIPVIIVNDGEDVIFNFDESMIDRLQ